eukprot:1157268-Amphidinium_carterae.1
MRIDASPSFAWKPNKMRCSRAYVVSVRVSQDLSAYSLCSAFALPTCKCTVTALDCHGERLTQSFSCRSTRNLPFLKKPPC